MLGGLNTGSQAFKILGRSKRIMFDSGIHARLPEEYKKFYKEWKETDPEPVHYVPKIGNWVRDPETGEVKRQANVPLVSVNATELSRVLLGGELIIFGYQNRGQFRERIPHFWVPAMRRSVVYSEVLDKYFSVIVTTRLVDMIHKYQGLDSYLLQTKPADLCTDAALKLKRKILLALSNKELPYDEEKNKEIYEKYKPYLLTPKEIEWFGLNISEAVRKLEAIEEEERIKQIIPLKHKYRKEMLERLAASGITQERDPEPEEISSGWVSKLKSRLSSGLRKTS